jgi:hypothetical protein
LGQYCANTDREGVEVVEKAYDVPPREGAEAEDGTDALVVVVVAALPGAVVTAGRAGWGTGFGVGLTCVVCGAAAGLPPNLRTKENEKGGAWVPLTSFSP